MLSGARPSISLASLPTAMTLLSNTEIATTEGSLIIIPLRGIKTKVLVVPRSMPIFLTNIIVRPALLPARPSSINHSLRLSVSRQKLGYPVEASDPILCYRLTFQAQAWLIILGTMQAQILASLYILNDKF